MCKSLIVFNISTWIVKCFSRQENFKDFEEKEEVSEDLSQVHGTDETLILMAAFRDSPGTDETLSVMAAFGDGKYALQILLLYKLNVV